MKRLAVALLLCLIATSAVGFYQSRDSNYNVAISGGGGSFTGIVDIYGSANTIVHYGNRAASSAQRGQKLLNVCDAATGLVCADWSSSATTGLIVPTTIGGSSCGVIACELAIAYDDSGKNACIGALPCNLTQTHGTRPGVTLSSVNGLPSISCSGAQSIGGAQITAAPAQPITVSVVAQRTGNTAAVNTAFAPDNSGNLIGFNSSSGGAFIFAGSVSPTVSGLTENAFHAFQGLYATTGKLQADGASPVTGAPGTGVPGSFINMCDDNFGDFLTGNVAEAWFGTGDQSANFGAAHTNQSSAYGTP